MSEPLIQIVDEQDLPIGEASKKEIWAHGLWHRIVRVIITDENGRFLLQKRAKNKYPYPNLWCESCSGHVDVGEDYLSAAKRELKEELGISEVTLKEMGRFKTDENRDGLILKRFNMVYSVTVNSSISLAVEQKDIAQTKWFARSEIAKLLQQQPDNTTLGLNRVLKKYYGF